MATILPELAMATTVPAALGLYWLARWRWINYRIRQERRGRHRG